jgi:hypothetical protein
MTPDQRAAILAAVKAGNKIEAIKLCRETTGMGLAEAKDFVERLETSPDAQLAPAPEAGALSPVADLLFKGEKIAAIQHYRAQVQPGGPGRSEDSSGATRSRAARAAPGKVHGVGTEVRLHDGSGRARRARRSAHLVPFVT